MKQFLLSMLVFSGLSVNAQLLKDNFSGYITGNDLNTQGGWTNNSSNAGGLGTCVGVTCSNTKVSATSISYTGYGTSPKTIGLGPGQDGVGRQFLPAVNSGSVYVSMIMNLSSLGCSGTCGADADFFRILNGSAGNNIETATRLVVQQATGGFKVGIGKGAQANGITYTSGVYSYTTTHLIVIKYTINSANATDDIVSLYVDPNFANGEPGAADVTTGTGLADINANISIDRMAFRLNALSNERMPVGTLGAISVSTTWSALSHIVAAVNNSDRDIQQVKIVNISASQALLQMTSTKTDLLTIEVIDAMGRVVLKQTEKLQPGKNQFSIETLRLASGVYNVRAVGSKGVTPTVRFVK
jgi:hypothetical protein